MVNYKERRHLERFSIPGAKTLYKLYKKINLFNRYNGPTNLKDITKHGACIEIKEDVRPGNQLLMRIIVPGEQKISVRGQVVWTNKAREHSSGFAGIQFSPYGEGKPYNSFKTREALEKLTQQYLIIQ